MTVPKVLLVNGVNFMPYASYSMDIEDIDSEKTGRNAEGTLTRDRIATKHKLFLSFRPLTEAEQAMILEAVAPKSFNVTYTNTRTASQRTGTFYAGPQKTGDFTGLFYEGVSFNLIEL